TRSAARRCGRLGRRRKRIARRRPFVAGAFAEYGAQPQDQKYRDQPDENDVVVATHEGAPRTRIPSATNYIGPDWGKGKATPRAAPSLLFQPKAGGHGLRPPRQPCRRRTGQTLGQSPFCPNAGEQRPVSTVAH